MAPTNQTKAEALLTKLGTTGAVATVRGTGKKQIATVTLDNGRVISTDITGDWEKVLEKQIRRFKDKE